MRFAAHVDSNNLIVVVRPYGGILTLCHNSIGNPITLMRFTGRMFGHILDTVK